MNSELILSHNLRRNFAKFAFHFIRVHNTGTCAKHQGFCFVSLWKTQALLFLCITDHFLMGRQTNSNQDKLVCKNNIFIKRPNLYSDFNSHIPMVSSL